MSLDPLFRPRSVAVVGASRSPGSIGAEILRNLLRREFQGPVYPVNPKAAVVQSVVAYPSLEAIPGEVDLAVIVVPRAHVEASLIDCVNKKVRAVVVISAGFGELGEAGREEQQRLVDLVRGAGIRMVGPNCLGLLNTDPAVRLDATFAPTWPPEGKVAFSSQSGALGLAILDYAQDLGIGISQFVSVGNKADVSGNDLLEYWSDDERTDLILLYLESFGNPRNFIRTARELTRRKPIVAVKSGRTSAGARAASSHTGSLAGSDRVVDAALAQAGIVRTNTIEEMFDLAMILENQPLPAGNRVAVITNAGGPAIMASDACEARGLRVPEFPDAVQEALRSFLPAEASTRNPVDMIASATADSYERALSIALACDQIDSVIVLFVPPIVTEATDVARAIMRASEGSKKPVVTSLMGTHGIPKAVASLREGRFPSYPFPESAALALARAVRCGEMQHRPRGEYVTPEGFDSSKVREIVAAATTDEERWMSSEEVRTLLDAVGIDLPRSALARRREHLAAALEGLSYPVVAKLESETLTHKSDVGGVVLDLSSLQEVEDAHDAIAARLADLGRGDAFGGILLQEMIAGGVETFVGLSTDPGFGPLVAFGIGGTQVEVWKDVVFRVAPLADVDAESMTEEIRGKALLDGFRGGPKADRAALHDVILRLSALAELCPEVLELDINPLVARAPGKGAIALDARVKVAGR